MQHARVQSCRLSFQEKVWTHRLVGRCKYNVLIQQTSWSRRKTSWSLKGEGDETHPPRPAVHNSVQDRTQLHTRNRGRLPTHPPPPSQKTHAAAGTPLERAFLPQTSLLSPLRSLVSFQRAAGLPDRHIAAPVLRHHRHRRRRRRRCLRVPVAGGG